MHVLKLHWNALQERYRICNQIPGFWASYALSLVALVSTLLVNSYAIEFATYHASNPVTDIFLSNIPLMDVDGLFVYSTMIALSFITFLCLVSPRNTPFTILSISLFIIIRAGFTSLTHLGPFETQLTSNFSSGVTKAFFGGDYFFSGHAGMPFLFALLYWRDTLLRWVFIIASAIFSLIVLLGHLHYSIDVAAAYFITYTIYTICKKTFKNESLYADFNLEKVPL